MTPSQEASYREPEQGEEGYTPNEDDFCTCGATFQPEPLREGKKRRRKERQCPNCGALEGRRRSWHERTGRPYENQLLPNHRVAP